MADQPTTEGRILGVDLGSKRIGLALSDVTKTLASPMGVLKRTSNAEVRHALQQLIRVHGVESVVVGYPRNMNGTVGPEARGVERDVERLIAPLGLPVVLWDERLSSFEAERLHQESGRRKGRERKDLDARAAAVILQSYLDRQEEAS